MIIHPGCLYLAGGTAAWVAPAIFTLGVALVLGIVAATQRTEPYPGAVLVGGALGGFLVMRIVFWIKPSLGLAQVACGSAATSAAPPWWTLALIASLCLGAIALGRPRTFVRPVAFSAAILMSAIGTMALIGY